jgi:transposase
MATTQAILRGKDTTAQGELYSSFELGDKQWKITASDGKRKASRYSVDAGDTAAVADCLRDNRERPAGASRATAFEGQRSVISMIWLR